VAMSKSLPFASLGIVLRAATFSVYSSFYLPPGSRGSATLSSGKRSSCTPFGVVRADLVDPGAPVHKGCAVQFVLEPVEEGVDAGREADRRLACQPLVREAKECTLAVGGELPAYDALLPLREFLPGLDVPLVFEDPRRLPHEDLPRHVILRRAAPVVDAPPFARIEAGSRQVPAGEMLGLGEGFPHDADRVPDASLECDGGVLALERDRAALQGTT